MNYSSTPASTVSQSNELKSNRGGSEDGNRYGGEQNDTLSIDHVCVSITDINRGYGRSVIFFLSSALNALVEWLTEIELVILCPFRNVGL